MSGDRQVYYLQFSLVWRDASGGNQFNVLCSRFKGLWSILTPHFASKHKDLMVNVCKTCVAPSITLWFSVNWHTLSQHSYTVTWNPYCFLLLFPNWFTSSFSETDVNYQLWCNERAKMLRFSQNGQQQSVGSFLAHTSSKTDHSYELHCFY